jgi:hypothetical protein
MERGKAAELNCPMGYLEVFSERVPKNVIELTLRSERLFKASVILVCVWALIEAPLEISGSISCTLLLAVVASKVLIGLIGMAAIINLRFARQFFMFICGASVLAIAPALPLEYTHSIHIALFSTVECLGKAVCVATFAIASLAGDSSSEYLSVGNVTPDD